MTILLWALWVVTLCMIFTLVMQRIYAGTIRTMTALNRRCEDAFHDVDTLLKRRHNLLPALTAHASALKDDRLLINLNEAGAHAASVTPELRHQAELALSPLIQQLLSALEDCPEINSIAKLAELHQQLSAYEKRITTARRLHNRAVQEYYAAALSFPVRSIAPEWRMRSELHRPEPATENVLADEPVVVISL